MQFEKDCNSKRQGGGGGSVSWVGKDKAGDAHVKKGRVIGNLEIKSEWEKLVWLRGEKLILLNTVC